MARSILTASLLPFLFHYCLWIPEVEACGGLFCEPSRPVVQAGEAIVFGLEGNKVTMHVQILYEGPAEAFSWVLPVPQAPTNIAVGSDVLFTALFQETLPTFVLNIDEEQSTTCTQIPRACAFRRPSAAFDATSGKAKVLETGTVGPFDFVTLEPAENNPDSVFRWLESNGYDQPDGSAPLLNYYALQGQKFVALRLTKNTDAGEIQPLILSYEMETVTENTPIACVPIKLTAIAANDNMPVQVYVLADFRAVPLNYLDVKLDDSLVDWVGCLNNPSCYDADYRARFQTALAPLDNHGFVTEYAGSTDLLKDKVAFVNLSLDKLKTAPTLLEFLTQLANAGVPSIPLVESIIETYVPNTFNGGDFCADLYRPDRLSSMVFCLDLYQPPSDGWTFDAVSMAEELDSKVFQPVQKAQAFVDSFDYMTRMYGVLGPETMDKDPFFTLKPDAPNVSHIHTAHAVPVCAAGEGAVALEVTVLDGANSGSITVPARPLCSTWRRTGDPAIPGGISPAIQLLSWGFPDQTVRVLDRLSEGGFSEEEIREVVSQADSTVVDQTVPNYTQPEEEIREVVSQAESTVVNQTVPNYTQTQVITQLRSSSEAYAAKYHVTMRILVCSALAILNL